MLWRDKCQKVNRSVQCFPVTSGSRLLVMAANMRLGLNFFHHALSHNINLTNQKKPGEFENAFIFKNLTAHPKLSFQKPANPLPPSGLPRQWLGSIGADFLNYTDFVRMLLLHMSDVVVVAGKQSCEAIKHENVFIHAVIGSVCWGTVWESLPGKANKTKQNKTKQNKTTPKTQQPHNRKQGTPSQYATRVRQVKPAVKRSYLPHKLPFPQSST